MTSGVRAFIEEDPQNLEMVLPAIGEDGAHLFNVTLLLGTLIGNALPLAEYLVDKGANVNV